MLGRQILCPDRSVSIISSTLWIVVHTPVPDILRSGGRYESTRLWVDYLINSILEKVLKIAN